MMKNKKIIKVAKILGSLIFIAILIGIVLIQFLTYKPMKEAQEIMKVSNVYLDGNVIVFNPSSEEVRANIVFYPGGLISPEAYAVLGYMLSENNIRVFVPRMRFNLAILNVNAFEKIYERHKDEREWYIGGHSLGGASASIYTKNNSQNIEGIFFLGSYPSRNSDLSGLDIKVLSIHATNDVIIDIENYENTKKLMPMDTIFIEIQGGNHSNFGFYGLQRGDLESTISREEQHAIVVEEIIKMIER